jgi:ABC-type branched-subunit amino acid transport system ATPase component
LGVFGENGCGKTSLLNVISGFAKPEEGTLKLYGKQITRYDPLSFRLLNRGIARFFQYPNRGAFLGYYGLFEAVKKYMGSHYKLLFYSDF